MSAVIQGPAAAGTLTGLARALVQQGKLRPDRAENFARKALQSNTQFIDELIGFDGSHRPEPGRRREVRRGHVRPSAARPRRGRSRTTAAGHHRPEARGFAARRRVAQARQPARGRDVRPDQPAGAGPDQVPDPAGARHRRRRARQADEAGRRQRPDRGAGAREPGRRRRRELRRASRRIAGGGGGRRHVGSRRRARRPLPAEAPARCDRRRRLRPALRAVREVLPDQVPDRRRAARDRAAAAGDQGAPVDAHQGHLEARHLGKARAAGRADEARPVRHSERSTSASARCPRCSAKRS